MVGTSEVSLEAKAQSDVAPSLSSLLRFGRAEVLLPQSMATGLQNTFFAAFFIHVIFFSFLVYFF